MPEPSPSEPPAPTLVIDTSCTPLFVGILDTSGNWLGYSKQDDAALEALFPAVDAALNTANCQLADIRSFVYSEGPGSVLGLRLCAMAIETWSRLSSPQLPLYSYNSLQFCAQRLRTELGSKTDFLVVSDWKKNAWNAVHNTAGILSATDAIDTAQLNQYQAPVYHLPQRKGWQAPPENAQTIDYDPLQLAKLWQCHGFLRHTPTVELYNTGANTFQKWSADRHRSPNHT